MERQKLVDLVGAGGDVKEDVHAVAVELRRIGRIELRASGEHLFGHLGILNDSFDGFLNGFNAAGTELHGLIDDLDQLFDLFATEKRVRQRAVTLRTRLGFQESFIHLLRAVDLADFPISIGEDVLQRHVLGINRGGGFEARGDLRLTPERFENLGEQFVAFHTVRLPLQERFHARECLVSFFQMEEGFREFERQRGAVGFIHQAATVRLGGPFVALGFVENLAEFLIRIGFVAAEDAILVGRGEPRGGFVVERVHDVREGIGRLFRLLEAGGVELAQFVFGDESTRERAFPAWDSTGRP